MSRRRVAVVLVALAVALGAAVPALASDAHPTLAELESEVYCPTCKSLLSLSNAPIAQRMRQFIRSEIARDAERVNRALENIGARRLHTILERLLEDISFAGPENAGKSIRIELADVQGALADLVKDEDLSRYVL